MMAALRELCGPESAAEIELQLALDGSMLGAAVLAVAAQGWANAHGSKGESRGGR